MYRRVRVLIVVLLFGVTVLFGVPQRVAAEQTNVLTANVDVKASGAGAHCWANASNTVVNGITTGELVHLEAPYRLEAPGGADDAYAYLTVYYNGGTYPDSKHEGQGPSSGYLKVDLNVNPGDAALYTVRGRATDWWGGTVTCDKTSSTAYIYFQA